MNQQPTITALMSVFNGEKWLLESLESMRNQTFQDFEMLLIDDGSTDCTPDILHDFAASDARVRIITKGNTGLTDSLNIGVSEARGSWIARMDADDVASPNRFELQIKHITSEPNIVLVGSGFYVKNGVDLNDTVHYVPGTHTQLVRRLERMKGFFPHSSAMYKASTVRDIDGYDQNAKLNEDWDLWLRFSEVGQIAAVRKPLVLIRKHDDQITSMQNSNLRHVEQAYISTTCSLVRRRTNRNDHKSVMADIRSDLVRISDGSKQFQAEMRMFRSRFVLSELNKKDLDLLNRIKVTAKLLLDNFNVLRFIRHKFFGSSIPKLLAREYFEFGNTRN